jgi:3-oxoacyl-[acyl-carrier protein] reductase
MRSPLLSGKVALVTGASRGIGKETSLLLAREGAFVFVNYKSSEEDAQSVVHLIQEAGGQASLLKGDVSDEADVEKMFTSILDSQGTIDIVVNNAGLLRNNVLRMTPVSEFDAVMATNSRGVFLCTRAALKPMIAQRSGKIINLSSITGVYGNHGQSAYAASKAAVIGFTKSIAKEVGGFGITVNAVAPGFIETEMVKDILQKKKDETLASIALQRFGTASEVANAVFFLASPLSDYISGQILGVDGCQVL